MSLKAKTSWAATELKNSINFGTPAQLETGFMMVPFIS